ncbi:hypothetical protein TYRP_004264, partial [Tyrophagus putrescentiae]
MARFYCQSIFNGYRSADLLYLNTKNDWNLFRDEFFSKLTNPPTGEIATSALCCIRKPTNSKHDCVWPSTSTSILETFLGPAITQQIDNEHECTYLTFDIENAKETKLSKAHSVVSPAEYPFVCSFERPSSLTSCPPYVPTTTTTKKPTSITTPSTKPNQKTTTSSSTTDTTTMTSTTTLSPSEPQCHARHIHGLAWPAVPSRKTSKVPCPDGWTGKGGSWKCSEKGTFDGKPEIDCTLKWLGEVKDNIRKVENITQLAKLSENLSEKMNSSSKNEIKYPGDLSKTAELVQVIQHLTDHFVNSSEKNVEHSVKQITNSVVKTCSKMLAHETAWKSAKSTEAVNIAEGVLRYIQYAGVTFGCAEASTNTDMKIETVGGEHTFEQSNIFMSAFNMDHQQPISFNFNGQNFSLTNHIESKKEKSVSEFCNHKIGVGAVFDKLSKYLSFGMDQGDLRINSEIVAFNYNNMTKTFPLPNSTYARMKLTHNAPLEFGTKPHCVFWSFVNNSWSSEGCWIEDSVSSLHESVCMCNHLTSFSVLMDVSGRETPSQVKNILTIVCTSLSVFCLILTIALFSLCRELQNRRTTILINLSLALILVDLLVLFGLDQVKHPTLCKGVSVLLLYSLLTSFAWMLMEGYQLYQMVILVFNNIGHLRMLYMYLIGYGVPLIMTAIAAVLIHLNNGLTNEYFCWITSSRHPYQILALIVPATLVIIINTVIMYLVLRTVFQMKFGKSGRALRPASSSSSPSKTTSSIVSSSPTGAYSTSNRQRNINLANGSDTSSNSGSSANSKKRLFEKNSAASNSNTSHSKQSSSDVPLEKQISQWMSYIKGYVSLIVLMGITWITYVLYIHQYGHFFSYIFIVLNGLQGVFIFITQFVFDSKTSGAVKKRFYQMIGQDYLRSMTNSSSTKNTVSSSYSTSTRTNPASSSVISETERSASHNGNVLNSSSIDLSSQSSSSGNSSLNQSSEMTAIFKDHSRQQRKYSLEYF